eukprot:15178610-Alexandrium_andersonii.AAC.2
MAGQRESKPAYLDPHARRIVAIRGRRAASVRKERVRDHPAVPSCASGTGVRGLAHRKLLRKSASDPKSALP